MNIIVKNYDHYNRAMGCHISSKAQYHNEMARRGMVSDDEASRMRDAANKRKEYRLSDESLAMINTVKNSARRGTPVMSPRMKERVVSLQKNREKAEQMGAYD